MACTAWEYEVQGHVIKETKVITGGLETFATQWGYTREGLLSWMQYPDGETLTYGYLPQGAQYSLSGSLGESLVHSSAYDAALRRAARRASRPRLTDAAGSG